MNPQTELGRYMKAAGSNSVEAAGRHLSEQEMIALYQGQMPEAKREASQAHLSYCSECLQLWRDVRDFLAPAKAAEADAGEFELRREWKELWNKIEADQRIKQAAPTGSAAPARFFAIRTLMPLAACAVLFTGLGIVTLFWRQEQQKRIHAQEVAANLQADRQDLQARFSQSEQDKQQLQEQLRLEREKNQTPSTPITQSNLPQVNNTIYELQLPGSGTRGSNQDNLPATEINVSASKFWVLRITPDKPEEFPSYTVKIMDSQNVLKWDSGNSKLDQNQNLVVTFPGAFLSKGKYQLMVYGRKGTELKVLKGYMLMVN